MDVKEKEYQFKDYKEKQAHFKRINKERGKFLFISKINKDDIGKTYKKDKGGNK